MANNSLKLSKNLLRMKFMQRSLDAETKKQLEGDEQKIIDDEHWCLDLLELRAKENLIIEEKSFLPCEDLIYGRISIGGFNPEVEKLMALMNPKHKEEEGEEEDTQMQMDVTDEEMAVSFESSIESLMKTFAKRKRESKGKGLNQNVMRPAQRVFVKRQD